MFKKYTFPDSNIAKQYNRTLNKRTCEKVFLDMRIRTLLSTGAFSINLLTKHAISRSKDFFADHRILRQRPT
ncbi:hypothetical protein BST24_16595 [Mycobacteroides franklinii]|nr:hypothetical protein BST24_16595 [Mycobacteroides franklinii]